MTSDTELRAEMKAVVDDAQRKLEALGKQVYYVLVVLDTRGSDARWTGAQNVPTHQVPRFLGDAMEVMSDAPILDVPKLN